MDIIYGGVVQEGVSIGAGYDAGISWDLGSTVKSDVI